VKTCNKFKKFWKKEDIGSVRNEVAVLRRLPSHPNLLRFVDSFESPINIHIVTELCHGGDLFAFLNEHNFEPRDEAEARRAIAKILDVVQHCHTNGIAHLDIKLENLMRRETGNELDSGDLVLVDFGHSREVPSPADMVPGCMIPSRRLRRPVGSPSYAAPEVVLECTYSARSDVWSIGVICFVLLQGYLPFPHLQTKQWRDFCLADYTSCSNSPFRYEADWRHLSPEALDFVQRALEVEPERRMSLKHALSHPWIQAAAQREVERPETDSPRQEQSLLQRLSIW